MTKNNKRLKICILLITLIILLTGCDFKSKSIGIVGGSEGPEEIYLESDESTMESKKE